MEVCINDNSIEDLHVGFVPDARQLARPRVEPAIPRWQIAMPVIAMALLMIVWMACRPGAAVAHGAVSLDQTANATHKIELFQLPEWHDTPEQNKPIETADAR